MSSAEAAVANVEATESPARAEDANIDEVNKASKLAALKGEGASPDEHQAQSVESPNKTHIIEVANGAEKAESHSEQNGDKPSEQISPNLKNTTTDQTGEAKAEDGLEAVQDSTEAPRESGDSDEVQSAAKEEPAPQHQDDEVTLKGASEDSKMSAGNESAAPAE